MKLFFLLIITLSTLLSKNYKIDEVIIDKSNGYTVFLKNEPEKKITGTLQLFFDDNKTIKEKIPLSNGKIDGIYTQYYKSKKIQSKIDYKNSLRNGKHIVYFENGNKEYEANMKNGKKNGFTQVWYENGTQQYKAFFIDNKVNDTVKFYNNDGSVQYIEEFKNGKLVKQIKPKPLNNIKMQTRATTMYGTGKDIYYLFLSPNCPYCKKFLDSIHLYKDLVTFYIYLVPLDGKDENERKLLDIIYRENIADRLKTLMKIKNKELSIEKIKISPRDTYYNNVEILKAQQIQLNARVGSVPTIINTNGLFITIDEFKKLYK